MARLGVPLGELASQMALTRNESGLTNVALGDGLRAPTTASLVAVSAAPCCLTFHPSLANVTGGTLQDALPRDALFASSPYEVARVARLVARSMPSASAHPHMPRPYGLGRRYG